jgi:large subunit ribosomal protein L29
MKVAELRDLDVEVLRQRTTEIDDQLFRMRIQKSMGQLEAPGKVKQVRRERARILTILKEKAK